MTDRSVARAASRLGGLYTYGRTPDPAEEATARRELAVAKLDREIRRSQADTPGPDAVDLAHLVGTLMMWGGSPDDAATRLKRVVSAAVYATNELALTPELRAELAGIVAGEGTP